MKKQSKMIIGITVGVLLVAVIVIVAVIMASGSDSKRYAKHMEAAQRYMDELQYERAITEYEAAIEIEPNNAEIYQALAEAYIAIGDYESAVDVLERGVVQTGSEELEVYKSDALEIVYSSAESETDADSIESGAGVYNSGEEDSISETDSSAQQETVDEADTFEVFIQSPLSENQLKNVLPDEICVVNINGEEIKLDIVSFEIEKRKTDLNGKMDISYCAITMENEYYRYTKYLHLTCSYYDIKGGWLLDDWEYYNDAEYVVVQNPLTDDIFKNAIGDWDTIENINSEFHMESNSVIYQAEVSKINTYNVYAGTVWLEFFFNGNEWNIGVSSNDVEKKWNIIGTYYPVEGTTQFSSLTLQITDFDPESMAASGVVTVRGYKRYDWSDPLDERYFFDSVIFADLYNSGCITVQTETEKTVFWIQIHEDEAWVVYGNWSGRVSRNEG